MKFQQIVTILLPEFPYNLIKKMNTHTLYFVHLLRKLQVFENLKWVQDIQLFPRNKVIFYISHVKHNFLCFHM